MDAEGAWPCGIRCSPSPLRSSCRLLPAAPARARRPIHSRLSPARLRRARTRHGVAPAPPRVRPRNPRLGRLPREVRGVPPVRRRTEVGRPPPASAYVAASNARGTASGELHTGGPGTPGRSRPRYRGSTPGTAHAWPGGAVWRPIHGRRRSGEGRMAWMITRGLLKPGRLRPRSSDTQLRGLAQRARPPTRGDQ